MITINLVAKLVINMYKCTSMSNLSKAELKKQLVQLGIKVEGNYIQKKDFAKVLVAKPQKKNIYVSAINIKFKVYIGGSDIDKATLLDLDEALWACSPTTLEGPWDGIYEIVFDIEDDSNMAAFIKEKREQITNALKVII